MPSALPNPYATLETRRGTLRFYLADCLDIMKILEPGSVSGIMTSPPYNLGVRYRTYKDTVPRARFLEWTDGWIAAAAHALAPKGSLFLNVGAKPTDPWTAMEVAQTARRHLQLQNTIHWIKSIAIDKDAAGASAALSAPCAGVLFSVARPQPAVARHGSVSRPRQYRRSGCAARPRFHRD